MVGIGCSQVISDHVKPSICIPHRPFRKFRRYRYNVFTGWDKILSNLWNEVSNENSKTQKVAHSLLGKVVIYTLADTVGSIAGCAAGSIILGEMGSDIGKCLVSSEFLLACVVFEFLGLEYSRHCKTKNMHLIALTISTLALMKFTSSEERGNYGSYWGRFAGEEVGGFAGTILGGILLLKIAGSPTIFYDQNHPWDSYATSTARFLLIGKIFEAIIAKPSIPYIWPFLWITRKTTCIIFQNVAYNSNTLIQTLEGLRNRTFGRPQIPAIAKMALNTYCGHNIKFFGEEFSRFSIKSTFPSLAKRQFELIAKFDRFLSQAFIDEVKHLAENSDKMAAIAISAFYEYTELIANSKEIIEAHKQMRKAIFEKTEDHHQHKEKIVQMLREKISPVEAKKKNRTEILDKIMEDSQDEEELVEITLENNSPIQEPTIWDEGCQWLIDHYWTSENTNEILKTFKDLIMQMEISLVGFPLTDAGQVSYLNEGIDIYLQHYLLYLLLNYHKLEALTPQQEFQSLETLKNLIFNHYIAPIAPSLVTDIGHAIVSRSLKTAFKTQSLFIYLFRQPEQSSLFHSKQKIKVDEEYINDYLPESYEIVERKT